MAKFESTNPLLNVGTIRNHDASANGSVAQSSSSLMTLKGTAQKSLILLVLCMVTGFFMYQKILESILVNQSMGIGYVGILGASIFALVVYMVGLFVPKIAFICAPLYAISEGICLGAISAVADFQVPGVAMDALLGTTATFLVMFFGFSFGVFKVTQKFRAIVTTLCIGICVLYLLKLVVTLWSGSEHNFMAVNSTSPMISIGVSVFVLIVAACMLLLDFDNIAQLHGQVSKDYEWVCGMGLLATVVWIYIEILKLLLKLNRE